MPQPDVESTQLSLLKEINRVCWDFEEAWKSHRRPRIKDYLVRISKEGRDRLLLELIAIDAERRNSAGQSSAPIILECLYHPLDATLP